MTRRARPSVARACAATVAVAALGTGLGACETPTRPGEAQPLVEVQIADSRDTGDDYVSPSASVPSRARIVNDAAIDSPVGVTLKNAVPGRGGQVRFGPGGASVSTLSLPDDGSWASFSVRGASGQISQRDKDAVVEVAEDRSDGIVLARKALEVVPSVPSSSGSGVAIDVARTRTSVDDYVTWAPTRVRLSLTGTGGTSGDVSVTVRNMTPISAGRLAFASASAISASSPTSTATQSSVSATLPGDGSTVEVWVAGDCQIPAVPDGTCSGVSEHDKDAVLEVVDASSGDVLGRKGLMVRVRKDASSLTAAERDRFLDAVAKLNSTLDNYQVYQTIHATAASYAHGVPAFLAWHRAFVLRIERELQALEPAAALHYWDFDEAAPSLFDAAFMGDFSSSSSPGVQPSNPLFNWPIRQDPSSALLTGITRSTVFAPDSVPSLQHDTTTLAEGDPPSPGSGPSTYARFRGMESDPHNLAHVEGGGSGWLGDVDESVMDPLFFLLHSNVDRLWAKWQFMEGRYDPAASESYAPQGTHPGPGATAAPGNYAEDTMWPWDQETAGRSSVSSTPGTDFPQTLGRVFAPPPEPTPADVVPYDGNDVQASGLGFGYDDVPFRP